jgi:hypothetical protein
MSRPQTKMEMDYVSHNEKFMSLLSSRAITDASYRELLDELMILDLNAIESGCP